MNNHDDLMMVSDEEVTPDTLRQPTSASAVPPPLSFAMDSVAAPNSTSALNVEIKAERPQAEKWTGFADLAAVSE